jgi:ATP-dependent Clp protease ATP-binding subunit ClpA
MSYKVTLPFHAFKLTLRSGEQVQIPLDDLDAVYVGESIERLAADFATSLQENLLNKGKSQELLALNRTGNFNRDILEVDFPEAKDGMSYKAFSLSFVYFFEEVFNGYWGVIPTLGLQAFGNDLITLKQNLQETVQIYFVKTKQLNNVQNIISVLWYQNVELSETEIVLSALLPNELEGEGLSSEVSTLSQIAHKLTVSHLQSYGRATELMQLEQALQNQFNRNVLLVGTSGVGKTALILETIRRLQIKGINLEFWETTASKMIKELTNNTGWQDNIAKLIKETTGTDKILFVRSLMELFEVGQYEGNDVSIAAYLRTHIGRGEINILTECSEEELAQIELLHPNYVSLFHMIRLNAPDKELEDIIWNKVKDIARKGEIHITKDTIQEVIRLNQRYTPYSGFPGKSIRFLENILANVEIGKTLSIAQVIEFFCLETGMPPFMVDQNIPIHIPEVRKYFSNNLFGQQQAVDSVIDTLLTVKTALNRKEKPIASFLFVGPTGVGKTELAKLMAAFMFGSRERMIRLDMSEYSDPYAINRLIGGFGQDGVLTSSVRKEPFCILLFDEIEKADDKFYDLLLQILGEGRLTDHKGQVVNFCSTIIIMTSNIGANRPSPIELQKVNTLADLTQHYLTAVQKHFRPELFNRIDRVLSFLPLTKEVVKDVVIREIEQLKKREGIQFRPIQLHIQDEVIDYLAAIGYDEKYGARYLQRTLREQLILPLAQKLNVEDYDDKLEIHISLDAKNRICIMVEVHPMSTSLYIEQRDQIVNTDYCSILRRKINVFRDGFIYSDLMNELETLESTKKKTGEDFLKEKESYKRHTKLVQIKTASEQLYQNIEQLENNLSLACMGHLPYPKDSIKELENWEIQFLNFQEHLYSFLNPDSNCCYLKIYGDSLEPIFNFYKALLTEKYYKFECFSIWFDNHYYKKKLDWNKLNNGEDEELYIKQMEVIQDIRAWKTSYTNAWLVGLEFKVEGNAVWLFLEQETGIHRWKFSLDQDYRYIVSASNEQDLIPPNIHRKDAFKITNASRTVNATKIKDAIYDFEREYEKGQLVSLMSKVMEKNYKKRLWEELM